MNWAYLYFMKDEAARVREVAPHHARYWSETGSAERGGPFSDRSSGLIIIDAADDGAAGQMVANDPFQRAALLEQWWLKAWQPTVSSPDHGSPEVGRLDDAETRMVRDPLKVKEASDDVSFRSRACVRQSPPSEAAGLDGRTWRFR